MIKKVFETTQETKNEEIEEKVTVYETEEIVESGKSGKCGRCGRTYKYGDNRKYPEKCPYCVCKDCGESIMTRKTHAYYSGKKIDRCYICWHKYTYGCGSIYTGDYVSYNHEYPTPNKSVFKKIPKEKIIKVKKDVKYDIEKEIKLPDEKFESYYNIKNHVNESLVLNELKPITNLSSYLINKKIDNINNIDISKDVEWYNTNSIEKTVDSLLDNKKEKSVVTFDCMRKMTFDEDVIDEIKDEEEYLSPVGFYPNVPAYIQGHPLNMYNYRIETTPVCIKKKTIYCNLAIDSREDEKQYRNRGIIVYSMINTLIINDYNVTLVILDASFTKEKALIQKMVLNNETIKNNLDVIYKMLTSVEYYRVMVLNDKIGFLKEKQIYNDWERGSGFVLRMNDIRKLLKLKSNDMVIGSPEELEIKGDSLEEDYHNTMKSLNLITCR